MKIVIIGTGNTAFVLGRLIKERGHSIIQVIGRNPAEATRLSKVLDCPYAFELSAIDVSAELYIVAVTDKAIESISKSLKLKKGILVHTAGSVSKEVLQDGSRNYGVLYPFQSLHKEVNELPLIPFLVDGNTEDEITLLQDFASTLSSQVIRANDLQRKQYHLGAILVNNFPNYLYAKTFDFCRDNQLDFSLLLPLILQTSSRLASQTPQSTQTGPAIRGDHQTIERHLLMLENYPELQHLYRLFTSHIQAYFQKEA